MPLRHRGRWLLWAALGGVLVVIAAVVVVVIASRREGDVSNPDVEFDRGTTQPTVVAPPRSRAGHPADDGFAWPLFGFTKQRTHVLPLRTPLRPPFRHAWAVRGSTLIEFPPVLCGRSAYLLKNNGALYKISRWTGHVEWKRKLGDLAASSPACGRAPGQGPGRGTIYAVLLRDKRRHGGRVVALWANSGAVRWSRPLPSRAESSPLLDNRRLYFGTENGTVYALRASDGAVRWTFKAAGAVKGALALDNGRLFFGDYSGAVYAIRRADGSKLWKVRAAGGRAFGLGGGRFYSSPAVSYGRVYIGSTNGAVYSFAARNGKLAWRKQTGAYVYASPAVGEGPGGRPTVWIGSYNGTFYALDARSGRVRWSRRLGSKISGSAAVIGDLVFVSSLGLKSSWALDAGNGAVRWKTRRGAFSPAVSDGRRIYFNGYSSLFGLDPAGVRFSPTPAHSAEAAERKRAADHERARHVRYLRRKRARRNADLRLTCRRIQRRSGDQRAELRTHGCYAFWAWVARERRAHAAKGGGSELRKR